MTNFLAFIAFLTEEPTCLQISSVYKHPQCSTLLSPTPVLFLILYRSCVQSVTDVQPETLRLPFLRHIKWQICSEYCLLLSPWPFILMDALKRWKETSAAAVCGSRLKKKYILFFLFSSGERSFNEKRKLKKKKVLHHRVVINDPSPETLHKSSLYCLNTGWYFITLNKTSVSSGGLLYYIEGDGTKTQWRFL